MKQPFVGRKEELKALENLLKKRTASLVVVQGRRRIGKSRLIEEFASQKSQDGYKFYQFSGLPPTAETTAQKERVEFSRQLSQQTGFPYVTSDDWSNLFLLLNEKIRDQPTIVLFDEISWMGSKDPDFLGKLKNTWDLFFKKNPNLMLVLCGSSSTWIEKNILGSTGFLGRISFRLTLEELSIVECNEFWKEASGFISPYEKIKILAVTGGVPRYLEEINPNASAEENIKNLCFIKGGPLVTEFNDIFSDLFNKKSTTYKKIVQTLADGPLEINEAAKMLGETQSGFLSDCFSDLIKSGFVSRDYTWSIKSTDVSSLSHFRLSDNYLRFYLKYIDKNIRRIENNDFSLKSITSLPGWESIMGYQFENLVLRNKTLIKNSLRINPDDVISDNPFFQRATARLPGCQIDLLIQTKFGGLHACEIKFSKNPISTAIIPDIQTKLERFKYPKGFSCRPVLIHVNGVQEDVVDRNFFSDIIDFSQYLNN